MSTVAAVQETPQSSPARSLELTRVIAAPRPRVFDAWTRPAVIRQWFAPAQMQTPDAETNPVVGGAYKITMQGMLPDEVAEYPAQSVKNFSTASGQYTKINPYDLLQFTWVPSWEPGTSSLVTIHFRDVAGGTEVRLIHEQIASEQSCTGYTQGWTGCLDKLAALLSS
jgi:uncharacterized protein YndB with AHSA1/START domain